MTKQQTIENSVPFSVLATAMLTVTIGLLVGTFLIDTQIYRYFCLGAFTALLASTVLLLAVTKVTIWPATIVLRRGRTLSAL
jgi:hypothetical protein